MYAKEDVWPLILAAGDGTRLRSLTMTTAGIHVPKQFCSLQGGASFLEETLRRAQSIADPARVCTIVAAQHRHWWTGVSGAASESNWIVQPEDRGTANGILLGLLHVLERSPEATIILLPSDHHCRDEPTLREALRLAIAKLSSSPGEILLLGVEADTPDPELGYIIPEDVERDGVFRIIEFVEKPTLSHAMALIERGALWNALIVAAKGKVLLECIERHFPQVVCAMRSAVHRLTKRSGDSTSLDELYRDLPSIDFSRHVLQDAPLDHFRVLAVPACGWSDLGTPARIVEVLRRSPNQRHVTQVGPENKVYLNLAAAHDAHGGRSIVAREFEDGSNMPAVVSLSYP
jgi:mannose-1-phosphate guanylyltransferase